ncbi:MAG: sulfatase [Planctomycetota bacterium]|nr:sulfatase [Planctomycetota bacterium]
MLAATTILSLTALVIPQDAPGKQPPNILLLTADDLLVEAVGVFGCPTEGTTPHIDALAAQGLRFEHAHVVIASCRPSRNAMLTGRYPHLIGGGGFEDVAVPGIPMLPALLAEAGYVTGVLGKADHSTPNEELTWDHFVQPTDLGDGRSPELYAAATTAVLVQAQEEERPFFLMVNTHDPHRPFFRAGDIKRTQGQATRPMRPSRIYEAEEVTPPGFLPDLPEVRTEYARYLSSVRRADDVVGAVLATLEEAQVASNTIVVFLSDHGPPLPFAKSNCWRASTRTPLIVRWPNHVAAGALDAEHLVSSLDLMPTLVRAAGLELPQHLDGRDLGPLLRGEAPEAWREHVFTQFHRTVSQHEYPMRAVLTRRHSYVFNPWSDGRLQFRCESMGGLTWGAMERAAADDPAVALRVQLYQLRLTEELYDHASDPWSLVNLAQEEDHAQTKTALRGALLTWMERHDDRVLEQLRAVVD